MFKWQLFVMEGKKMRPRSVISKLFSTISGTCNMNNSIEMNSKVKLN